jgi:hypothetical protein
MMTQLNFERLSTEQTEDVLNLIPDAPELTNDKHLDHAFDCIPIKMFSSENNMDPGKMTNELRKTCLLLNNN